ncbi:hypothetical protein ACQPVP_08760 [Clostridium nigeriense]|uniref:hypothetical protein n=1 Tax=Clostridium nigeriense TaxID=1805470 RepID=UPI003D330FB6
MSDSVGKISLDLEIQSDISKQISNVSGNIANNLRKSLSSGMKSSLESVNNTTKKTLNSITSNINSSMKKSMTNIAKTMKSILSNIKMPKMNIPKPTNVSAPKKVDTSANVSKRGPPTLELENLTNAKLGKEQELDIAERQIDNLRNKSKLLNKQLSNTFNKEGRNKLEAQILSTESRMNSLINKTEKLGREKINLENKIARLGNESVKTGNKLGLFNNLTSKGNNLNKKLGNSIKSSSGNMKSYSSGLGSTIGQMFKWMIILPMIVKGLTAMATGVYNNLMTNEQFSNSLAQIKSNLMIAFTPIYEAILPAINALMSALSVATQYIASFISAIFGKTFEQSKQATQGLIDAKNAMGVYGDSAKAAGEAAKDALGLASFDEINSLNSQSSGDSSGSGGSGTSGVPSLVTPALDTSSVDSAMKKLTDKIKAYFNTFNFDPLIQSFNRLKKSVEPIVNNLGKIIKWFLVEILDPLAHWTISDLLPAFLNLIAGALDFLNPILEVFMSLGSWLWDSFLQPIASWTGGVIVDVLNGLADILSNIGDWISENKPIVEDLILVIGSFAVAWGLVTGAMNLWNIAVGIWNSVGVIATAVTTGFGAAMTAINWPLLIVVAAIGAVIAIGVLLYKHWDVVKAKAIEVWNGIKAKFEEFKNWLGNVFATDWSKRFAFLGDILNGLLANVRNIFNSVKQIFSGIIDFIAGVFTGNWSRAWQGVVSIFSGIMSGLSAVMKAPLNAVISLINGAISGLNKISVDIPSWVPGFGGKTFGINIPKIPMLAKGGLIDSPTLAMIGETHKKEAVVPLEGDTKALNLIADKLMERLGGTNISNSEKDRAIQIILKLGDIEFARALIDSINKLTEMNNGECLINL